MSVIVDIWWSQLDGECEGALEAEQRFRFELRCSFFYDTSWPWGCVEFDQPANFFLFRFVSVYASHERSEHQIDLFEV